MITHDFLQAKRLGDQILIIEKWESLKLNLLKINL